MQEKELELLEKVAETAFLLVTSWQADERAQLEKDLEAAVLALAEYRETVQ